MKKLLIVLSAIFLIFFSNTAFSQPQIPPAPKASIYVQDYAGVLSSETKNKINTLGSRLAISTKAQIVVVTVRSLEDASIEEYALDILRKWGVGDKNLHNGVVMLVSVGDRQSRIEVGYGLEGALNDAKTGSIQDKYMIPFFQKGDYDSGILQGYFVLVQETAAEYRVEIQAQPDAYIGKQESQSMTVADFIAILIVVAVLILDWTFLDGSITRMLLIIFSRGGGRGGGSGGGGFGGGSGGGGGSSRRW